MLVHKLNVDFAASCHELSYGQIVWIKNSFLDVLDTVHRGTSMVE